MGGDDLTRWTIRLALVACFGRLALDWSRSSLNRPPYRVARGLWTLSCAALWMHVASAFHFVHHWSHSAACAHTADQTAAVIGVNWGGGIWFNYLLLLFWAADVAWWWLSPTSMARRPALANQVWLGFLLFMAFNATVVFESGAIRWWGLTAAAALALLAWRSCRSRVDSRC